MSSDRVHGDQQWDEQARGETRTERLDRNWGDLIQEIRVVQTGVQFLTGFLLTLPFQQRFGRLDHLQLSIYLLTVGFAILATALLQTPVSLQRALFRRHRRDVTVRLAHRLAMAGIGCFGVAVIGVASLIFGVVAGHVAEIIAAACVAAALVSLWIALPLAARREPRHLEDDV